MITKKQIKAMRKALDQTQEQMAQLLQLSFVTINRWERGHSSPSGYEEAVLLLLQRSIDWYPREHVVTTLKTAPDHMTTLQRLVAMADGKHQTDKKPMREVPPF